MKIFYGLKGLRLSPCAVALGDFDAIHIGHQSVIESMLKYAKGKKLLSVVYMFSSRPNKNFLSVNTLSKRIEILEEMGVDCCVVEEFTPQYKKTSCEDFVSEYIKDCLNASAVFVGVNYRFGEMANGDIKRLRELCTDTEVFAIPLSEIDGIKVSSSLIREMIERGDMLLAKKIMGRYFSLSQRVIKGKQLGRTIGFPTANIEYPKGMVIPKEGVYITRSKIGNKKYCSVTNVGGKPTVHDEKCNIETVIDGFSRDIYGEEIEIEFCRYIRKIEKFDSLEKLKKRLETDMAAARGFFGKGQENE